MKTMFYLSCLLFISGCLQPASPVTANLSLFDTTLAFQHYVKIEIINHSAEDLYIPNLQDPIAIYKNDADITPIWHQLAENPDKELILSNIESHPQQLYIDSLTFERQLEYQNAMAQLEWPIMCRLNPIDSLQDTAQWETLKEMFDFLCNHKYVGFPIKSQDTVVIYQPIDYLFDPNGIPWDDFEIRFHRYQNNAYHFMDTLPVNGLRLYTPLLDTTVSGYKMYLGDITPLNTIKMNSQSQTERQVVYASVWNRPKNRASLRIFVWFLGIIYLIVFNLHLTRNNAQKKKGQLTDFLHTHQSAWPEIASQLYQHQTVTLPPDIIQSPVSIYMMEQNNEHITIHSIHNSKTQCLTLRQYQSLIRKLNKQPVVSSGPFTSSIYYRLSVHSHTYILWLTNDN